MTIDLTLRTTRLAAASYSARRGESTRLRLGSLARLEQPTAFLAVLLAPVATLRPSSLLFTFSDILFCVCFFLLLVSGRLPRSPLGPFTPFWLFSFLFLIIGLLGSSLLYGDPVRGLVVTTQYLFSYAVLIFILIRGTPIEARRLAMAFVIGILLVDVHGIITFYTVGYVPGSLVVSGARRLNTVLNDANLAAALNSLILPVIVYFWIRGLTTMLAAPMLFVVLFTIVLTGSNSGLLTGVIGLSVFLTITMRRRRFFYLLLVAGLGITVLGFSSESLPNAFRNRVLGAITTGDLSQAGTFDDRVQLMYEALDMIARKGTYLTGIGADQFRILSVQRAPVHNLYLLLWSEGGLLALGGWLLFSVVGFSIWLVSAPLMVERTARAAMISTLTAYLFVASSQAHMYARWWLTPLLLSFGLVISQARVAGTNIAGRVSA